MATLKCKMCGGDLIIEEGSTVCECEYCGTKQTVPTVDNEKKITLFTRANRLRANNEFDKAAGQFENIVAEFPEEAEAYWGLILCKYGIEYVDDPLTGKKIPTCHRSSFESVLDDHNFEMVMEYSDSVSRRVYREEAKQIEEIRKGIIEVSNKEEPYDIFICYKETDENGDRTIDSVIAQDVYTELTAKGYKVFFSRITLEDKLGQEYEPYIFAALHSAKVMLAFGTDYEYYNAVWVKNEWSRFLQLIANGEKKTLIPCYKDIDAYDMPKEFARLQAQDMGKVGAIQDLIRGIDKIMGKDAASVTVQNTAPVQQVIQQVVSSGPNVEALLKRGNMALEEKKWDEAKDYFNRVLDMDAECAESYLGFFMIENECSNISKMREKFINTRLIDNKNYQYAKRYAKGNTSAMIDEWEKTLAENERKEQQKLSELKEKKARLQKEMNELIYCSSEVSENPKEIELEKKIEMLSSQISEKQKIIGSYSTSEKLENANSNLAEVTDTVNIITKTITMLNTRKNSLGFFKKKEKEQLDIEIRNDEKKLAETNATKVSLQREVDTEKQRLSDLSQPIINEINGLQQLLRMNRSALDGIKKEKILAKVKEIKEFNQILENYSLAQIELPITSQIMAGFETFEFGKYLLHGKEKVIKWQVLEKEGNKLTLISKYAIASKNYHDKYENATWETCTLRNWLNNDFYNSTFTDEQKKFIGTQNVIADKNPMTKYGTSGNNTIDKIYLLSTREAEKYLSTNSSRKCSDGDNVKCWWWLRSTGGGQLLAAYVEDDGSINYDGNYTNSFSWFNNVRPVITINLE